jgi:hypothetical protein
MAAIVIPEATTVAESWQDASWFPVDLHVPRREFSFLSIETAVLERSVFLDTRIKMALAAARPAPESAIPASGSAVSGWLLHTSFCCSTLLARALHVPPVQVVLKEPLVLRRLADARHAGWATPGLLEKAVGLLGRPWSIGGSVIVKPTHAALNIAADLLDAAPHSRAVMLTSSLDDFLVSNLKKSPETQASIPVLAERALAAGAFSRRIPKSALSPPDLLCAAALQWAAQRELGAELIAAHGTGRVRALLSDRLLDDVPAAAIACARWLGGTAPTQSVASRAAAVADENAKEVSMKYDAQRRRQDASAVKAHYSSQIKRALSWFDAVVAPAMNPVALALGAEDFASWGSENDPTAAVLL